MQDSLKDKIFSLGIDKIKYHIFLCCNEENSKCCPKEASEKSWHYLKKRLQELHLAEQGGIFRSKSHCLRVCAKGPIAVIHPGNTWYHSCSEEVIEKIIQQHLINHQIVTENLLHTDHHFNNQSKS